MQQIKDTAVRLANPIKIMVLPQLISVADLDVSESFSKIMIEGMAVNRFIGCKGIGPAAVTTMYVAKKDEPGVIVEQYVRRTAKNSVEPAMD